jgi:hypothetical protein
MKLKVTLGTWALLGLIGGLTAACESSDPSGSADAGAPGGAGGEPSTGGTGGAGGDVVVGGQGGESGGAGGAGDPCEGRPMETWYLDGDGDGHGDPAVTQESCDAPDNHVTEGDDCDDARADAKPGAAELCNDLDDDCDGTPDNGLGLGEACSAGVGACAQDGVSACLPDGTVGCDAAPGAPGVETCNTLDDDCNGVVDDTGGVEICNGADDDCDGETDEGLGVGDACAVGVGACRVEGVNVCGDENGLVACGAAEIPAVPEVCDGLDNDCNGTVDDTPEGCDCVDGSTVACGSDVGQCRPGVQTCVDGRLGPCDGATGPGDETCDAADNDCNGTVDDRPVACECVDGAERACGSDVGACAAGTQRCADGAWGACNDTPPAAETCDAVDNDCNGVTDDRAGDPCECTDGEQRACGTDVGVCAPGTETCGGGHWGACDGATNPGVETCNGADDDCDGTLDNRPGDACECVDGVSEPCGSDVGACQSGTRACVDGHLGECVGAIEPTEETWNRADDDCNGEIDDLVCAPLARDFPAGPGFAGCASQDGTFHAFEPANISSISRTAAFDQIADLLWRGAAPDAAAFASARQIYAVAEGIDSRVQRRFDQHFAASVPNGTNCRTAGVPAQFPDYCVGPARISPIVTAAFDAGMGGQNLRVNAARLEAALLWLFYTSVYKESATCSTAIADCDSSHAYYSAGTARAQPAAMARYMNALDPAVHDRIFDGTLATHCWRELDNGATAMNLAQQAIALDQLDVALDHGAALLLIERVRTWAAAAGDERAAQWAFVQIWGQVLDRAVRVRNAAAADRLAGLLNGDGAGVDAATIEDILLPLMPCP